MDRHARHRRRPADRRRRPEPGWRAPTADAFDRLVDQALATLPRELGDELGNIEIVIEQVPPDDEILLGLYEGVPLSERGFDEPLLPARVTLYRGPLETRATSARHLAHEVAVTVLHEIAHHFGIDDDRLDDLGWG